MKYTVLFTFVVLLSFSSFAQTNSSVTKTSFPSLNSLKIAASPTISLHLKKLPAYNFFSTCNTCVNANRIPDYLSLQNNPGLLQNSFLNGNSNIQFNPYRTQDVGYAIVNGALDLFFDLVQDVK